MEPFFFPASQQAQVNLSGLVVFAKSILSFPSAAMPARVPSPLKLPVEVACNHTDDMKTTDMMHTTQNGREPSLGSGVSSGRT